MKDNTFVTRQQYRQIKNHQRKSFKSNNPTLSQDSISKSGFSLKNFKSKRLSKRLDKIIAIVIILIIIVYLILIFVNF